MEQGVFPEIFLFAFNIAVIVFAFSGVCMVLHTILYWLRCSARATARMVRWHEYEEKHSRDSLRHTELHRLPVFEFEVNGEAYECSAKKMSCRKLTRLEMGMTQEVRYDPKNPDRAMVASDRFWLVLAKGVLVLLLAVAVLLIKERVLG